MKLIRKNKAYLAILLNSIFNMTGTSIFSIVFLIYASNFENKNLMLSLAEIVIVFPAFLSIYTGELADKTKNKSGRMIQVGLLQTLLFLFAAILLYGAKNGYTSFFIIGLIKFSCDLLSSYKNGLRIPILQNNLSKEEISPAFGQLQSIGAVLEILAQAVGVSILTITGQSFFIVALLNAILYFISSVILFLLRKKLTYKVLVHSKQSFDLKGTFQQIKQLFITTDGKNNFIILISSIVLINFILSSIGPLTDLFLISALPFGNNYGLNVIVFNCFLAVGMISGSLFMKDIFRKLEMTSLVIIVFLFAILFSISLNKFSILSPLFLFLIAYCSSKTNPRINTLILDNVPAENLGKVSGGISTIFTFAAPFGASFFLFIANLVSVAVTFYIISFISLISILFLAYSRKNVIFRPLTKKR